MNKEFLIMIYLVKNLIAYAEELFYGIYNYYLGN